MALGFGGRVNSVSIVIGLVAVTVLGYAFWPILIPRQIPATPFALCTAGSQFNCVVNGDTFYLGDQMVEIADARTTAHNPLSCTTDRGRRASEALSVWLNAGPFQIRKVLQRGNRFFVVSRSGESFGASQVAAGLARPWNGMPAWCPGGSSPGA